MDLLTLPLRLPFLPIQAVIRLADVIRDQADHELHDPAAVRRQLESVADERRAGAVSDEEVAEAEHDAAARLLRPQPPRFRAAASRSR